MKAHLKRLIPMLLALLMIVGTASCGGQATGSSSQAHESQAEASESEQNSEPESESSESSTDSDTSSSDSQTTISSKDTTSKKPVTDPNADVKKDFKGQTFVIASFWSGYINPEYGKSEWGDKLLAHYAEIEKKYNCKIEFKKTGGYEQFQQDFTAAMLAGNYYADIIECQLWQSRRWIRDGHFAKLNGLKSLNLNADKFMKSKTELSEYGGNYYGTDFTSWYFRYINFNEGGMLFNAKLLKNNGVDPYALIKNGQWTYAKFREICKNITKDSNGDGKNDVWGVVGVNWNNYLWSTGVRPATWDSAKKKWVFGYYNNKTVYDTMQYLLDLMYVDKVVSFEWVKTSYYYGVTELFAKGKAAFIPLDMEWITYGDEEESWFLDMKDDYGFIPMPLADGNKSKTYKGRFGGEIRLFHIPKTVTKSGKTVEDVAFFFDRLTNPLAGTNTNSWKEFTRDEIFRGDQNAFNWYYELLNNAEFDRSIDMGALQLIPLQQTVNKMFLERAYTPAQAIDLEREAFNIYLDEYVNKDKNLLKP